VRALDTAGITVDDVEVRQPSLDDVFFALTGHQTGAPPSDSAPPDALPCDTDGSDGHPAPHLQGVAR
jgi:ABC-2 type transport system ATP-binding protein